AAAALEIQLHVLTRLGKRPSLALWNQMLTRTMSSLFVNAYLNQSESLALKIAIKKMGMGLELASDMIDHAASMGADHLAGACEHQHTSEWVSEDMDWDDTDHLVPHDPHIL